jgi:hypothetical protein
VPLPAPGAAPPGWMPVAFDYERLERPIKSVGCLNAEGDEVATLSGSSFTGQHGGTYYFHMPKSTRIGLRVVYFGKTDTITVPLRLETGVGF